MKETQSRLFIQATNVHQGGGKSLLDALLAVIPSDLNTIVQLDQRMILAHHLSDNITKKFVAASILKRLGAEWWLKQSTQLQDMILCFGNLPPLFKLRGHVVLFIQNRYLIDDVKLDSFPLKTRLKLCLERIWLFGRLLNADELVVQTPSMKAILDKRVKGQIPIRVLPFMKEKTALLRMIQLSGMSFDREFDFLYVASGEPHKNHRQLINAWCLLSEEGIFPSLKLTLDRLQFSQLCIWIDQKAEKHQLNVENMGSLDHEQVKQLYERAGALVYPSTLESFGLPLIEARQAGLPVLAPELDYVRDVLDPEQTFEPESATSIARAVKRFIGIEEKGLDLQNATGFLKHILGKVK